MYNYKLIIQYDGNRYKGWQRLGNDDNTIQGKIERVLSEMVGEKIEINGCGRTDAGVHALCQVANVKLYTKIDIKEIHAYMNRYLPQDICIKEVTVVDEKFHARYAAKSKTYLYKIWNREYTNPFMRKYSMHVIKTLDIEKMKAASFNLIGEHDFTAFTNAKSKKKTMVREIYKLDVEQEDGFINIRVQGNGFLHNMVRKIVGTLIEVGLGDINEKEIHNILEAKERSQTGLLAEPWGLYLEQIEYE